MMINLSKFKQMSKNVHFSQDITENLKENVIFPPN